MFLTCDPDSVLDFLGLDTDVHKPFESVESMYKYVCECLYFKNERYARSELKANDRKRMAQRDLYRAFIEDWLPTNAHLFGLQKGKTTHLSRNVVLEESLIRFGKREEYEKRVEEWRKERGELLAKQMGRRQRKADAVELEEYASAWMRWLDRNV